jgi:hypothetical protein
MTRTVLPTTTNGEVLSIETPPSSTATSEFVTVILFVVVAPCTDTRATGPSSFALAHVTRFSLTTTACWLMSQTTRDIIRNDIALQKASNRVLPIRKGLNFGRLKLPIEFPSENSQGTQTLREGLNFDREKLPIESPSNNDPNQESV